MKTAPCRSLALVLLTALSTLAQGQREAGLPLPTARHQTADQDLVPLGKVQATITGLREDDPVEDVLQVHIRGRSRPLPLEGSLNGLLRKHARNRTLQVVASLRGGAEHPTAVLVEAMEGVATQDLPIYGQGQAAGRDAPLGTLPRGQAVLISSGAVYGRMQAAGLPSGFVQLGRLSFGEPMVRADDDQALTGILTADREDDPVESAPTFRLGNEQLEVSGPLKELLREHGRYRLITVQGTVAHQGIRVRAVRGRVKERLPLYALDARVGLDQPQRHLAPGELVWVIGGSVYGEVLTADGASGKVLLDHLSLGDRLSQGMIETLARRD